MAFTGAWGQWYEESEHPRGRGGQWVSKGGDEQPSEERQKGPRLTTSEGLALRKWIYGPKSTLIKLQNDRDGSFARVLEKLPVHRGEVYRGIDLTKSQLSQYKPGSVITLTKHSSASTASWVPAEFLQGKGIRNPTVLTVEQQSGRRIPKEYAQAVSTAVGVPKGAPGGFENEEEVILLKGTKLEIVDVTVEDGTTLISAREQQVSKPAKDFSSVRTAAAKVQQARQARVEQPSDELTPAEEIVKQGGTPEYRRLDTPYLRKTLADYEAEAAKYPKEGEWIKRSAEKYRKELEWREAVTQVRKEKPTSVGDITETFDVSREGLEEYSSPIQVGDIEYRIGQGVGYSPLEGGDYVMMDGLIVQGPRDRLAKPASDYPDVEAAIEKKYKESLTWQGGDFSKAQPTQYRHLVGKLLWGYKSPLTGEIYAAFMNKLAAGYFSNGQVVGDAKDNQIELAKKNLARDLKEGDAEHKEWVQRWYDREFKGVRMIQAMMREIRDAEWKASMVSQEAVNQFAAFVKDTQTKLNEAHPNEKTLTLYRGVQGDYAKELKRVLKKEEEAEIDVSPIDSWSTDESVARKFAGRSGAVIKKQVPISEILFSHEGPRGSGLSSSDYLFGGQSEAEQLWGHSEPRMRIRSEEVS